MRYVTEAGCISTPGFDPWGQNFFVPQMSISICVASLISLSSSLIFAESPLTLGLWLIVIALNISLFTAILTSKWFGIILFLVYVGGLLVIFAYFCAISPNQLNDVKTIILTFILSIAPISLLLITIYSPAVSSVKWRPSSLVQSSILTLNNSIPLVAAAIILFFTIVIVIKIAPNHQGPLRPFSYCYYRTYCFENNIKPIKGLIARPIV